MVFALYHAMCCTAAMNVITTRSVRDQVLYSDYRVSRQVGVDARVIGRHRHDDRARVGVHVCRRAVAARA